MSDEQQRNLSDPSALTSAQIFREIGSLKELFASKFEGYDKAIVLLQNIANRSPTINEVYLQHEEKFNSIEKQFTERDVRAEQTAKDSKVAVDAALQAQKEAAAAQNESNAASITKQEAAFTKQIDQLGLLIQQITKGFDEKIDDVKGRMTRIEGRGEGVATNKTEHQTSSNYILAFAAVVLSAAAIVVTVILKG